MKKHVKTITLGVLVLMVLIGVFWSQFSQRPSEATFPENHVSGEIPVKGMPTMVDLGANECIPCKMMVPVMENVEKKYKGKAAIIFIDVWKDKAPAKRFGVRAIPTQIFFDKEGKEIYRHEGFMSEAEIDRIFKKMGVS
jgi:thioredoxin 1